MARRPYTSPEAPILVRVEDVAAMMNLSARTIWRRVADGSFPAPVKYGAQQRWRRSDVVAYIESRHDADDRVRVSPSDHFTT